jgi:hypothetical protein
VSPGRDTLGTHPVSAMGVRGLGAECVPCPCVGGTHSAGHAHPAADELDRGQPTRWTLCRACGLDFGSVSAIDAHRVGKHAYTFREGLDMEPLREDGRRCLDPDELEAHGLVLNSRGGWSLAGHLERGRAMPQKASPPSRGYSGRDGSPAGDQEAIPGLEVARIA